MNIRKFRPADEKEIWQLFYDTVHSINSKDYTPDQIQAWAPEIPSWNWQESLRKNLTFIAEINGKIIGFADMTKSGFLEGLYVHKDYQGQKIASQLLLKIEQEALSLNLSEISTEASFSSKPFFEKRGFTIVKNQIKQLRGVSFPNFTMRKTLLYK